jgi:hypothetical protein
MKTAVAVLGMAAALAWAGPALAGGKPGGLLAGGRTIGGPGDSTLAASATETIAANIQQKDACATVTNTGSADVVVTLTGSGTQATTVPTRKTAVACEGNTQTVTLHCNAVGTGACTASWRVDSD